MSIERRMLATAAGLLASRFMPPLPDRLHPVARFGAAMTALERRTWRNARAAGVVHASVGAAIGAITGRVVRSTTAMVAVCAAGQQLRDTALGVGDVVDLGDLDAARAALPALVGRDPSGLDESGIAAAAIESVAENMVDAVFAPAFWGVVAGAPGVGVHRALNTMDAMVGRRTERYERFGWAAARADDVANFPAARLFAAFVVAVSSDRSAVVRAVRSDAGAHPSPNAGVAEAAMAGALGVELGGPLRYGTITEDRPTLGTGPRPDAAQLRIAVTVAERAETMLIGVLVVSAVAMHVWRRDRTR